MHTQIAFRYSIIRTARRALPALYLIIVIVACSLMPFASPTAWADLQTDTGVWGVAMARGNFAYLNPDLSKRWLWWVEGQARFRECCNNDFALNQSLLRPGLGYALTDQSTVWVGYARVENYLPNHTDIPENRIWEQYMWSGKTPLGAFTFRPRLEQRWQANGSDMGSRFRQFLKFSWPISFLPEGTDFVVWDEVFVNLYNTNWGTPVSHQGLDQNRGFVGIGYRFTPEIKTEIGYLNQYIETHTNANDRMNNIFSVWLFFDLYKK
jgi:Protein of unknown function (DUF2490)